MAAFAIGPGRLPLLPNSSVMHCFCSGQVREFVRLPWMKVCRLPSIYLTQVKLQKLRNVVLGPNREDGAFLALSTMACVMEMSIAYQNVWLFWFAVWSIRTIQRLRRWGGLEVSVCFENMWRGQNIRNNFYLYWNKKEDAKERLRRAKYVTAGAKTKYPYLVVQKLSIQWTCCEL